MDDQLSRMKIPADMCSPVVFPHPVDPNCFTVAHFAFMKLHDGSACTLASVGWYSLHLDNIKSLLDQEALLLHFL